MERIKHNGINTDCISYPCHKDLDDCTFCFCPYYPCGNENKGGRWVDFTHIKGEVVWDCSKCTWIHKIETVEKMYDVIDRGVEVE